MENGFYPVFTDTSKNPDNGQKECLCRREENTVWSSSEEQLKRISKLMLAVPWSHGSWVSALTC